MKTQQTFQNLIQNLKKPLTINQFKSIAHLYPIIDTRPEGQITGIIKNSLWFPGQALHCSWLPSFINPSQQYLVVCDRNQLDQVLQRFVLMGYFNCVGYNNFDLKHYDGQMSYPTLRNYRQLGDSQRKQFLDVRTPWQWSKNGVVQKSILIQLKKLDKGNQDKLNMLKQIQNKKLIVINCRSGQRIKLATSILLKHGINSVALIQNFDDFPKFGLKIQTFEQNQKYWTEKGDKWAQISSQEENQIQKQIQSDNMNRMAVQECYLQCRKNHPQKSPEQCIQICQNNKKTKQHQETTKMQHSFNKNQLQARKQGIVPSKHHGQTKSVDSQKYQKALSAFKSKNYLDSIDLFNQLITQNPNNAHLFINRALSQASLGNLNFAYSDLLKAIKLDHLNFVAYFNLASLLMSEQRPGIEDNLVALQNIKRSLSCLYLKKGMKNKDGNDIQKAIELYPHNLQAILVKGLKMFETNKYEEALDCLKLISQYSDKNEQMSKLVQKVKQNVRKLKGKQINIEDNPEIQKVAQPILKVTPSKLTSEQQKKQQNTSGHFVHRSQQQIDKQIEQKIQQWNKVYKQIYGDQSHKLNKISVINNPQAKKDSKFQNYTVWIVN